MSDPQHDLQHKNRQAQPRPNQLKFWCQLLVLSSLFVAGLELVHAPAAFLLGPMLAAIILVLSDHPMTLHAWPFRLAQVIVGLMMASHMIVGPLLAKWLSLKLKRQML